MFLLLRCVEVVLVCGFVVGVSWLGLLRLDFVGGAYFPFWI